jgi:hypothetical protein
MNPNVEDRCRVRDRVIMGRQGSDVWREEVRECGEEV